MHKTKQIKTRLLKVNNQKYVGFQVAVVYSNKKLISLVEEDSFSHKGLTYFNVYDLPRSITDFISSKV